MSRGKTIGLWVLSGLLGALFLLAGFGKVTSQPGVIQMFRAFGYPDGFYMLIGVVELFGAVALLVPRMAPYGAVALMVVMIGATYTHVVVGDPITFALGPVVIFLLLGVVGWARRPALLRASRDSAA